MPQDCPENVSSLDFSLKRPRTCRSTCLTAKFRVPQPLGSTFHMFGSELKLAFEWKWLNPSEPLTEQQLKAPRQFPYVLSVLIDKVVGSQKLKEGFSVKAEIPLAEAGARSS